MSFPHGLLDGGDLEAAKYDHNLNLENSESPQFFGRCIAALTQDKNSINRTGGVLISAEIAQEYSMGLVGQIMAYKPLSKL